jgi:hypothetical protein
MRKSVKEVFATDQVKVMDIISLVLEKKRILWISILVIFSLGMVYHFFSTKEFESVSAKLSETKEGGNLGGLGQISGLAGLAGVSLPGGGNDLDVTFPPELYPRLVYSPEFLKDILDEELYFQNIGKRTTLRSYLISERPRNFVGRIKDKITETLRNAASTVTPTPIAGNPPSEQMEGTEKPKFLYLSPVEQGLIGFLSNKIKIEVDGKVINLSVKLSDPNAAAELNGLVFNKIIDFVTQYRTEKQRVNLSFVETRTKEAEESFLKAQQKLASFRDSNQGLISQQARSKEEQLQAEFSLGFNLYNGMKQELENARLQLKENTPIFTSFIEPSFPNRSSNLSFVAMLFLSGFLGAFIGILIVATKLFLEYHS